jgi:hypothetical protein
MPDVATLLTRDLMSGVGSTPDILTAQCLCQRLKNRDELRRLFGHLVSAALAITAAVLSGGATVEAILRANWSGRI